MAALSCPAIGTLRRRPVLERAGATNATSSGLFSLPAATSKKKAAPTALSHALDALNMRYGKNTVYFGSAHNALNNAPMRIAFNHIPDLEVENDAVTKGAS